MVTTTTRGFVVSGCSLRGPKQGNYFDIPKLLLSGMLCRWKKKKKKKKTGSVKVKIDLC